MWYPSAEYADGAVRQLWKRDVIEAAVRVLLVEDDADVQRLVRVGLERHGMTVEVAAGGGEAIRASTGAAPDVVVLDIELPDVNGLEVLEELRRRSGVPVILLSGRRSEADRVTGLERGADDYVVKPFSLRELAARIHSLLRRSRGGRGELAFPGLVIDPARREVRRDEGPVPLTRREFDLLATLASSPGRVFSRSELLVAVWGSSPEWQDPATVTEHVHRLRAKIEPAPSQPRYIRTVRGVGYRFDG